MFFLEFYCIKTKKQNHTSGEAVH